MARWSKQTRAKGSGDPLPLGYDLRVRDMAVMRVRPIGQGWYWYGMGKNTSDEPCDTPEAAKAAAMAYYQAEVKRRAKGGPDIPTALQHLDRVETLAGAMDADNWAHNAELIEERVRKIRAALRGQEGENSGDLSSRQQRPRTDAGHSGRPDEENHEHEGDVRPAGDPGGGQASE